MASDSIYIQQQSYSLHLKRFYQTGKETPVLLIHGSIENGKIFYSDSGKGLAPFLAKHGYQTFVPDLRGRGKSTPLISSASEFGIRAIIREDFPLYIQNIKALTNQDSLHVMAHSWGGVLVLAHFARFHPELNIKSFTFFGSRRQFSVPLFKKFIVINVIWRLLGNILTKTIGYFPAKPLKIGSDNESKGTFLETDKWVKMKKWVDQEDGFDFQRSLQSIELPPLLSLTGTKDKVLGHPRDIDLLLEDAGNPVHWKSQIIGEKQGHLHDYGHIDLLTHPDAVKDHFHTVIKWLDSNS